MERKRKWGRKSGDAKKKAAKQGITLTHLFPYAVNYPTNTLACQED